MRGPVPRKWLLRRSCGWVPQKSAWTQRGAPSPAPGVHPDNCSPGSAPRRSSRRGERRPAECAPGGAPGHRLAPNYSPGAGRTGPTMAIMGEGRSGSCQARAGPSDARRVQGQPAPAGTARRSADAAAGLGVSAVTATAAPPVSGRFIHAAQPAGAAFCRSCGRPHPDGGQLQWHGRGRLRATRDRQPAGRESGGSSPGTAPALGADSGRRRDSGRSGSYCYCTAARGGGVGAVRTECQRRSG